MDTIIDLKMFKKSVFSNILKLYFNHPLFILKEQDFKKKLLVIGIILCDLFFINLIVSCRI